VRTSTTAPGHRRDRRRTVHFGGQCAAVDLRLSRNTPATGRVLFAGTQHRSLGVVTGSGPSQRLLGPGPVHFDDQPAAVGGAARCSPAGGTRLTPQV